MFESEHTQLVIFCPSDGRHDKWITHWLKDFRWYGLSTPHPQSCDEVDMVRNATAREMLRLPDAVREVLWIDGDMAPAHPTSNLQPFYAAEGDVIAAFSDSHNKAAYADPNVFHMGMVRIRLDALRTLWERSTDDAPLFQLRKVDRGTRLETCECESFARQVRANGMTIVRAGYCAHNNPRLGGA